MIRKTLYAAVVLLAAVSCGTKKGNKSFEVSGKLTGMGGKTVYMVEQSMFRQGAGIADSAITGADGSYHLETKAGEATAYTLFVSGAQRPFATVINDAGKITLNASFTGGNVSDAESYDVKGSEASTQIKDFLKGITTKMSEVAMIDQRSDSLQRSGATDSVMRAVIEERSAAATGLNKYVSSSIAKSDNPAVVFYELGNYQAAAGQFSLLPISDGEVDAVVNRVTKKNPEHEGWAYLKTQVEQEKVRRQQAAEKSWVGKQAPEITAPDANGNNISLSSYRGKYVLVDFWASWCSPCRRENPNVVAAYSKYKSNNFDILGVSLDRPGEKDKWLAAVKQDGLVWKQISELREWESSFVSVYKFAEEGIPYNILVDPQGIIIAERLSGPYLHAKLAEVLK